MSNSFSENIRNFRKANDLTQESFAGDLAKILRDKKKRDFGKSVSQWESGKYPQMETCIAIAELMEISLDDLFSKEIQEFKSNYVCQLSGSKKFKDWPDEEIEMFYHILQDLRAEKRIAIDGEPIEILSTYLAMDAKTEGMKNDLYLKIGELTFEEKIVDHDGYNKPIEKWLQSKVLKYFVQQKVISYVDVHNGMVDGAENESNFVAQVYLDLDYQDVEDLFVERAKRKAAKLIETAREEIEELGGLL